MERNAPSPEPKVYSIIYICWTPKKEPSHEVRGEYLVTVHGTPRGRKVYIQWCAAWFPQGDRLRHCYHYPSVMQPSAQYLPPWFV